MHLNLQKMRIKLKNNGEIKLKFTIYQFHKIKIHRKYQNLLNMIPKLIK